MVPELLVLALEVQRSPIRFGHLSDPTRPLPEGFGAWLMDSGTALAASRIRATAEGLGTDPRTLRAAFVLLLRQTLLPPGADHYRVLGLSRGCPAQAIKRHHGLLLRLLHPDRTAGVGSSDAQLAARVNAAYQVLRDPQTRQRYDGALPALPEEVPIDLFWRWEPPPGSAPGVRPRAWVWRPRRPEPVLILGLGVLAGVLHLVWEPRGPLLWSNPVLAERQGAGPAYLRGPHASALEVSGGGVAATSTEAPPRPPRVWVKETEVAVTNASVVVPTPPGEARGEEGVSTAAPLRSRWGAMQGAAADPPAVPSGPTARGGDQPGMAVGTSPPAVGTPTTTPVAASPPRAIPVPSGSTVVRATAAPARKQVDPLIPAQLGASADLNQAPRAAPPATVKRAESAIAPRGSVSPGSAGPGSAPFGSVGKVTSERSRGKGPRVEGSGPGTPGQGALGAPTAALPIESPTPLGRTPFTDSAAPAAQRPQQGGESEAAQRVIGRLERALSTGDVKGLLELFTANAEVNGARGAEAVHRACRAAAGGGDARRLRITGLSWRPRGDQGLLGQGTMRRDPKTGPGGRPNGQVSPLEIELVSWMGDYKIARLRYPFAGPKQDADP